MGAVLAFATACAPVVEPDATPETVPATQTTTIIETSTAALPSTSTPPPDPADYEGMAPQVFGVAMEDIVATVPRHPGAERTIALTFDGCGGPAGSAVDWEIINTLREFGVPATLFVSESWIEANPETTRELIDDPLFRLENHGTRHVPLSVNGQSAYGIHGTANPAEVIAEVDGNRHALAEYGVNSTWFRSGTAHYDDVAVRIARDLGVQLAGFSVSGDDGAHASASTVASRILNAPDGSIVLAHFNHPGSGTAPGLREALNQLAGQNVRFVFVDGTVPGGGKESRR